MPELCKQATIFFGAPGKIGWTERYFLNALTYEQAKTDTDNLVDVRRALSTSDLSLAYVRISDVGIKGDSVVSVSPGINGTFPDVVNGPGNTEPWTALNIRLEGGTLYRGRKFIHGLPQALMGGSFFTPSADWTNLFTAYVALLKSACCLYVRDKTVAQPAAPMPPIMVKQGITNVLIIGTTTRHVGRPFGLQVGRRLVRA